MLAPEFKDDFHDFTRLLTFTNSDFYSAQIIDKALHDYKDSIQPYLEQAKLMADGHNFRRANSIYASLESRKMDTAAANEYRLEYGFSLYCAGEYTKAIAKFNLISDPAFAGIKNYFLGQSYLKSGNKMKAMGYFKLLSDSSDPTKYGYLASLQMGKLIKK